MITPLRHLKQIPTRNKSVMINDSEQKDEWVTKIWPSLRQMVLQDTEIQDIRKERIGIIITALMVSGIFSYFPKSIHSFVITTGAGILIYAISMYVHYGDNNILLSNPHRKAILLNIIVLMSINFIVFVCSYIMAYSRINRLYSGFLPFYYLYLVMVYYIFTITSCRDGVFIFNFERNDKALKNLFYKVKNFESDLIYFALYPKMRYFNGDIAIDVYPKVNPTTSIDVEDVTHVLTTADLELAPNESDFNMHVPLLTSDPKLYR